MGGLANLNLYIISENSIAVCVYVELDVRSIHFKIVSLHFA